ncbi:hypothetical protein [Pantoea agglomerans]|uniref:hypothetical protein n=1 Tax=Enterobacter agglomerans TaxID=549 RepID=UPI002F94B5B0
MNIITVEKKGLLEDFRDWGVNPNYAEFFLSKCDTEGSTVALKQFVFNDTIQLDDKIQWLLVSSAFWCRAFREAETQTQHTEALSAIRAIYFAAGFLGASPVVALIRSWWSVSYELHLLSSPNQSQMQVKPFRSSILNSLFNR